MLTKPRDFVTNPVALNLRQKGIGNPIMLETRRTVTNTIAYIGIEDR